MPRDRVVQRKQPLVVPPVRLKRGPVRRIALARLRTTHSSNQENSINTKRHSTGESGASSCAGQCLEPGVRDAPGRGKNLTPGGTRARARSSPRHATAPRTLPSPQRLPPPRQGPSLHVHAEIARAPSVRHNRSRRRDINGHTAINSGPVKLRRLQRCTPIMRVTVSVRAPQASIDQDSSTQQQPRGGSNACARAHRARAAPTRSRGR